MFRTTSRLAVALTAMSLALAAGASARPAPLDQPTAAPTSTAVVASSDLRSPDARDAARGVAVSTPAVRAPSGGAATLVIGSPDTRDAARGLRVGSVIVSAPAPASTVSASEGFQWGDAAIGGAALLGLLGLAGGVFLLASHHRNAAPQRTLVH